MSDPRAILERSRTVAVVGASADPWRASHSIPSELQRAGYRVIPVNPNADEVLGEKAYDELTDVPDQVDLVNVFRRPEHCPDVVRQAAAIGAGAVWLQLGIRSEEARAIAEEAGLDYVEDDCTGARVRQWRIRAAE